MNNNSSDLTIKKIFKYIFIFVLLCIFVYSLSGGMIVVNALTTSNFDKSSSYLGFTLRDGTSMAHITREVYFDQPVDFSIYDTKYDNLYLFYTYIIFPEYESFEEYSTLGSSVHFYLTLHFKYFYDITNTNNFSASHLLNDAYYYSRANIYEDKIYTSISDEGKISYDQFITFEFPYNQISSISSWSNLFHIYTYLDFPEVPNLGLTVDLVNAMFTTENATPMSIDEYIANSDIEYYDPEFMPYEDYDDDDGFFSKLIESIVKGIRDPIIKSWKRFKALFKHLFIPEKEVFKEGWLRNFNLFEEQLGIIFLPFELIETILNKYLNLGEGSGIIHIPTIKDPFYNQTIISSQDLNLKEIFSTGSLKDIHEIYLVVIDGLIIISLSSLAWKKFNSIFKSREGGE